MLLGSKAYITSNLPAIKMNNKPLQYVNFFKNLGLWITSTLDWKAHVDTFLKRFTLLLVPFISTENPFASPLKNNLFCPLFSHFFDYASIAFIDLDKTRTSQLQVTHNSCIRFIFGCIPVIPTSSTFTHLTHKRL